MVALLASGLPIAALIKLCSSNNPKYVLGYIVLISLITVYINWSDKRKAQTDSWRTPENTLHLLELAGGWAAAYFAQRFFRHKTSKTRYQVTFWFIAVIQNYVALEYLLKWRFSKDVYSFLKTLFE
ncbi:hypothetical protein GCM10007047_26250 [Cerasicoccus arenae]|uniref:DUF1294 domain-containing protein n=1 Tax=Cerasicoccus arenae TaxID=424488 RepID=A0A8J3DD22_9BACT|nr:hypothetical protein GCM10007047_26250 [Cerasicoccus arenae]